MRPRLIEFERYKVDVVSVLYLIQTIQGETVDRPFFGFIRNAKFFRLFRVGAYRIAVYEISAIIERVNVSEICDQFPFWLSGFHALDPSSSSSVSSSPYISSRYFSASSVVSKTDHSVQSRYPGADRRAPYPSRTEMPSNKVPSVYCKKPFSRVFKAHVSSFKPCSKDLANVPPSTSSTSTKNVPQFVSISYHFRFVVICFCMNPISLTIPFRIRARVE